MSSASPPTKITVNINELGILRGFEFPSGIQQFSGIPYASLAKRWTRSVLKTSWEGNFHDGTKLGTSAPNPPEYDAVFDATLPVSPFEHYNKPDVDELNCLVINITRPASSDSDVAPYPVMVFIHGGSFLCGGSNTPAYNQLNFVSHSVSRDTPVVAVSFNYRVGLGGFLASEAIRQDLSRDGYEGNGNFGLFDQQVALDWIQRYISSFHGDKDNITIFGESAGSMSVAHQIYARNPAVFHRAILMSGGLNTIPTWPLEKHEQHFREVLRFFKIDPLALDALDQLRRVPEKDVAAATLKIEGSVVATGNPCNDGVFHTTAPRIENISPPSHWLKAIMIGDVYDEAMIFRSSITDMTYESLRNGLLRFLNSGDCDNILDLYSITPAVTVEELHPRFETLAGDVAFRIHNLIQVQCSTLPRTYLYHFDQRSTIDGPFKGLAYHLLDVIYLLLSRKEKMKIEEMQLATKMAGDWIDFAYGKDPWEPFKPNHHCMVYGPNSIWKVKTDEEDEPVRKYSRMRRIIAMGIFPQLAAAIDFITTKRDGLGNFE